MSTQKSGAGRLLVLFSSIVMGVSAFLPWGTIMEVSVKGIKGDGKITFVMAVLIFLLTISKKIPLWIFLILGLTAGVIGIVDLFAMSIATEGTQAMTAIGIYLTIISAVLITIGALMQAADAKK
ncbi:MAG: hypothetical protein AAB540_03040 [Patescibacteria group bacterium]